MMPRTIRLPSSALISLCISVLLRTTAPSAVLAGDNAYINPYENATLKCSVTNPSDKVTWNRNGAKLTTTTDSRGNTKYIYNTVNNTSTVTVLKCGENDIGDYGCQVNGVNIIVQIQSSPYIKPFEKSKNLVQGETLTLECKTWAFPTPEITWYRDSLLLVADKQISFRNGSQVNSTLVITNMNYEDYKNYMCVSNNTQGSTNATILVRVKDKLAALYPFLGICAEVVVLCIIIFVYEKKRSKQQAEEARKDEAEHLTNSTEHKDDVRHRNK